MKCVMCGGQKMTSRRETRKYTACDLPNVVLKDVEVRHCPDCGEEQLAIPRVLELHRGLALQVVRKPGRLTGKEVRFLRKFLGWSGADFARHVGAQPETVSRWENEHERIGATYDRLLRLSAVHFSPIDDYPLEDLERADAGRDAPLKFKATAQRKGWQLIPA